MASIKEMLSLCVVYVFIQFAGVKADVTCGFGEFRKLCIGWTAHCCDYDATDCCFYHFYSFWWFWMIWVVVFLSCASCGYCCRRRYVQRRAYQGIVVVDRNGRDYGTANNGFVEQPAAYAVPPAYPGIPTGQAPPQPQVHKPPQYAPQQQPPEYKAQP